MPMHNVWLVAKHEFLTNIRKPSFLFAAFGVPLMMVALFAVVFYAQSASIEGGIVAEHIGYIDQIDTVVVTNDQFTPYENVQTATSALENGEIDTFFVLTPLYMSTGNVPLYSQGNVSQETRQTIKRYIVENVASDLDNSLSTERLLRPVDISLYLESTQRALTFEGLIGLMIVPMIFVITMMMALQLSSTFLMAGIVEEKSNHIMEILITSITPYQLLLGKLLGLGTLGLVQLLVILGLGLASVLFQNDLGFLSAISLPLDFVLLVLVYFVLTYFLIGSLLAGIGAISNSEQESRTLAGIFTLTQAIPFFFFSVLLTNPDSPLFVFFTLFPMTAALTYMLRFPFTAIPTWQIILSIVLLLLATLMIIWAASKVFRWALLLEGKRPNPGTLLRVIFGRSEMGIIPTQSSNQELSA